jgi:hypothetical protein
MQGHENVKMPNLERARRTADAAPNRRRDEREEGGREGQGGQAATARRLPYLLAATSLVTSAESASQVLRASPRSMAVPGL